MAGLGNGYSARGLIENAGVLRAFLDSRGRDGRTPEASGACRNTGLGNWGSLFLPA